MPSVHGQVHRQVKTTRFLHWLTRFGGENNETPAFACMTADSAEVLTGDTDFHESA
jgi:hypothetical protein